MRIEGAVITEKIYADLRPRIAKLAEKQITPHVAVILVGDDEASKAYVSQKQKKAEELGISFTLFPYENSDTITLLQKIDELNNDATIHGIIVQRPLPETINGQQVTEHTAAEKDVDGFHEHTPFDPPLPAAVQQILETVYQEHVDHKDGFHEWLKSEKIVVMGKGETAGAPVIRYLNDQGIYPHVVDSQTKNPDFELKSAKILISAVGKERIVTADKLTKGVILIGVGLSRRADGRLVGDYDEEDIKGVASFYTPNPGGVGPVNVAMLLANVVKAAERMITNDRSQESSWQQM